MNIAKKSRQSLLTVVVALCLFFVASALYFLPQFQGEVLSQHDVIQYEGMAHDIFAARDAGQGDPQWTGGMFGGMPAYLINVAYPAQIVRSTVGRLVRVMDTPAAFLFFAMVAMWLALLMIGFDPLEAIVPALAYGFSTYFILIIGAGHLTKMWAAVYAPLMMGGAWVTLRGNRWVGAVVTALATSLEIAVNHPQITYYFLLAMGLFWVSEAVVALRAKQLKSFAGRTGLLAAAGLLALLSNFAPLWYTAQHTPDTIRGGSELAARSATTGQAGLDIAYATAWSYSPRESWNLLIPDFAGRESGNTFPSDGAVAATGTKLGLGGLEQSASTYWGGQPYTGGPTYLGAAVLFLALLGLMLTENRNRWWLVAASVLALLFAWGQHIMPLTELFFKYLPGYNKFRTVSMALVIVQWAMPLAAGFAVVQLLRTERPRQAWLRAVAWSAGIVGGLCLFMAVAGGNLFDFGAAEDAERFTYEFHRYMVAEQWSEGLQQGLDRQWGSDIGAAMAVDRVAMMRADAWRSLLMVVLAALAVLLFVTGKVRRTVLVALLAAVVLLDLVPVNRRFLAYDRFQSARSVQVRPSPADEAIWNDAAGGEPGYRVENRAVSTFNDATTSYFHRSVGGYHGAKLSRYQDLIDYYLADGAPYAYAREEILDMLNTRYQILPTAQGNRPQRRDSAFGAAWVVDEVMAVGDAATEIQSLGEVDLRRVAVVSPRRGETTVPALPAYGALDEQPRGEVTLVEYRPNHLKYEAHMAADGLAVFSEIYYDKGWTVTVDGVEVPYLRADYLLRALPLTAGDHLVEWRFRAPKWAQIEALTLVASLVILAATLALAAWGVWRLRGKKEGEKAEKENAL